MTYAPPIAKRNYINALSKERSGKIIAHTCSKCREEYPIKQKGIWFKCREEYPIKQKGIWFESASRHDVWCWVCKPCLDKRGIRCE